MTGTTAIPGVLTDSVTPSTADCGRRIPDPKNNESAIKIFMGDTEAV
jgi:hypothetical protein